MLKRTVPSRSMQPNKGRSMVFTFLAVVAGFVYNTRYACSTPLLKVFEGIASKEETDTNKFIVFSAFSFQNSIIS